MCECVNLPVEIVKNISTRGGSSKYHMGNHCLVLGSNNTRDQGLTIPKACIDIGQSERTAGVC